MIPSTFKILAKYNKILNLRNPRSTRPWQHVFETLNGYIMLGEKLYNNRTKFNGPWNFGPSHKKISTKDIGCPAGVNSNGPIYKFLT